MDWSEVTGPREEDRKEQRCEEKKDEVQQCGEEEDEEQQQC